MGHSTWARMCETVFKMRERAFRRRAGRRAASLCVALTLLSTTNLSFAQRQVDAGSPEATASDAGADPSMARKPLRVGYVGSPPFVQDGAPPSGLAIGVWEKVARRADARFTFRSGENVSKVLDAVADGELDVAVGPISITSQRAASVDFTQPYFQAEIGILAMPGSSGMWSRIAPFLARVFAGASLLLIVVLGGVGTLIWVLERRKNPEQFPQNPVTGIGNGIWFALVTMTTVGYGDRAPVTTSGRLVSGLWMLIALVTTSSLTAGIASAFTVVQLDRSSIESAADLPGQTVGVVRGATAAAFAREQRARIKPFPTLEAAAEAAEAGDVAAVVHDRPMLRHYLAETPSSPLKLAAAAYQPQGYGFAVNRKLPQVLRRLDVALLSIQEDGTLANEVEHFLGGTDIE